jgi:hypothetical protein
MINNANTDSSPIPIVIVIASIISMLGIALSSSDVATAQE